MIGETGRGRMPKWRPFTWVIVIINVLFLVWIVAGVAGLADECADEAANLRDACEAGTAVGATIGVGIIIGLWAFVDVILGVLWLVTKPKARPCPVCGNDVRKGEVICRRCGYDFRTGVAPRQGPPGMPPPP
jgi:hypothetical protein